MGALLYVIATPLGNLEDISLRALRIFREVDLILAEDCRQTKKLLQKYQIKKPLLSYCQHTKLKKLNYILNLLRAGKNLALVSDSGTPGISDPGGKLIQKAIELLGEKVKIIPVPGPSALICAASICAFPMEKFLFLGFLPKKKKRKKILVEILSSKYPVIFYESRWRLLQTLNDLKQLSENIEIFVARELTKKFETVYRGKIGEVIEKIKKDKIKGEFVIIIKRP